jgi:hypothetical protein
MSRLNVSRLMEIEDTAVPINVQSGALDSKLDDERVVALIREPLTSHYDPCSAEAPPLLKQLGSRNRDFSRRLDWRECGPKSKREW